MNGSDIRKFFRELLGSRLVETLELDLLRLRQDYDARLQDKEIIIATLREEKAGLLGKVSLYENTLMPRASRAGAEVVNAVRPLKPNFKSLDLSDMPPVKSRWSLIQEEHDKAIAAEIAEDAANKAAA